MLTTRILKPLAEVVRHSDQWRGKRKSHVDVVDHFTVCLKTEASDRTPPWRFFLKGHLLDRQFLHKAGCIQLFLVPIVKNVKFLLVSWATDWYYEDRSKDGGSSDNILYRRKVTAAGGFRGHLTLCRLMSYICRTAPLTSRRYILNISSKNIHTEYFKHAA
jgi:hypothetical protein